MKPPPFSYYDPRTVADAVGLLARLDNAKVLAGGQSLMPMLNMRYVLPDHVIDLNRDWAWASQQETRQRIAAYRSWEPQVYVDFHEMGTESSYFFPPAAEPINPLREIILHSS